MENWCDKYLVQMDNRAPLDTDFRAGAPPSRFPRLLARNDLRDCRRKERHRVDPYCKVRIRLRKNGRDTRSTIHGSESG